MAIDPNFRPYKHTGNIAVDIVASCINNYAIQGATLKCVRLDAIHWHMFKSFVIEMLPTFSILDNEIDFDGVIVMEGKIQTKSITWEFDKTKKKVYLMN